MKRRPVLVVAVLGVLALGGAALLIVAALWLERSCRIPDEPGAQKR